MNNLLNAQNLAIVGNNKEQIAKWKEESKLKSKSDIQRLKRFEFEKIIQGYSYYSPGYSEGGIHTDKISQKYSKHLNRVKYTKNYTEGSEYSVSARSRRLKMSRAKGHKNKHSKKHSNYSKYNKIVYTVVGTHEDYANYKRYSKYSKKHKNTHSRKHDKHNKYAQKYSRYGQYGRYSKYGRHSKIHTNYTTPHTNTHSNSTSPHTNTGGYHVNSPSTVKKYEHNNYVPSRPEVLLGGSISDNKNILTGQVTLDFISYDRNADGYGDNDTKSKDVLYDFQIRRVQDLKGNTLNENWQTLITNGINDSFTFNVEGKKSGILQ